MKAADSFLLMCVLLISLPLHAEEVLRLGEEDGWNSISTLDSVTLEQGRGGYYDLLLEEQSYNAREEGVDLLLHFDNKPFADAAGFYTVEEGHEVGHTKTSRFGGGAAKFTQKDGGLHLKPREGALFDNPSTSGSFSIEFWLYPYHLEDGEVLLSWEGQNTLGDRLNMQRIRGYIEDRKLTWDFTRIFFSPDSVPRDITISGIDRIVPRKWHHHLLTFDAETGLLEYYLDGRPEAVRYTTDSGREGGTVNLPYFGRSSGKHLSIGPETDALIDELRISRKRVGEPLLEPYTFTKGRGVTELIDLDTFGAELPQKSYKVTPLPVSAAFHTPLVQHASDPFAKAVEKQTFHQPTFGVYSNTTGDVYPENALKAKEMDFIDVNRKLKDAIKGVYPLRLEETVQVNGHTVTLRPAKP
ncbi:MAG: LamG-like jellyroll fold domain-containing protein, partial [Spirochaetia bacterium]